MTATSGLRVGIVGGSRTRNGTGPYVARFLHQVGARVVAVSGRSFARTQRAARELECALGHVVSAASSLDELLTHHELDAVAICCPSEAHADALEAALDRQVHAFCEKPLLWCDAVGADPDGVASLCRRYAGSSRVLRENVQWPYTLRAFDALHGFASRERPEDFTMRLSPPVDGPAMWREALSHPASMLVCLGSTGELFDVRKVPAPSAAHAAVSCMTHTDRGPPVHVLVELAVQPSQPRSASYAINGRQVTRKVRLSPEYAISFVAGEREIELADPLFESVRSFVHDCIAEDGAPVAARPARGGVIHDAVRTSRIVQTLWECVQ